MIPDFGFYFLILAVAMAGFQSVTLALPTRYKSFLQHSMLLQSFFITLSFACLIVSYIESDFSVLNVFLNSHSDKPLIYKISASWGNHEGSMILWVWVLSLHGLWLSFAYEKTSYIKEIKEISLGVLGVLQLGFLSFIIFTSNPFERLYPIPANGQGLNPLLQDIGLALHPPLLYAGYVGFGLVFAVGISALLVGKLSRDFAIFIKPFIMVPWVFLSLGIAMGSWWAYRELGWGGWWFWDAVENASLLPWLVATALFHSNIVLIKRGKLGSWVVLLSIMTFSLSMIGTFLVRSGIVTSVHSFANDPERGIFILIFIFIITGGALLLYSIKAHLLNNSANNDFSNKELLNPFSREGFVVINNLFLVVATASILLATLYPMVQEIIGARAVTVGAPYYNKTFFPLLAPLILIGGVSTIIPWQNASFKLVFARLRYVLIATITASVIFLSLSDSKAIWLIIGVSLGFWMFFGSVISFLREFRLAKSMNKNLELAKYSVFISHIGIAIFIFAIAMSSTFNKTYEATLTKNEEVKVGIHTLELLDIKFNKHENYIARQSVVKVTEGSAKSYILYPELRAYPVQQTETTESAISSNIFRDIYIVARKQHGRKKIDDVLSERVKVQLYVNYFMVILWFSMVMIAFGGVIAIYSGWLKMKNNKT